MCLQSQRKTSSGCNQSQLVLDEGEEWLHDDDNRLLLHGDDTETIIEVTLDIYVWDI